MCGIAKNTNLNMEESNRERDTSDAGVNKTLMVNLTREYMDKLHKVMIKHDQFTINEAICKMIDNELKV